MQLATRFGLGEVSFACATARGRDVGEVVRCVHEAIEKSVEVIDVADDAEREVGDAVRVLRARERVIVATRVPALAAKREVLSELLPVRYVQERVEASLRATRLDVLPLVQLPVRAAWREHSSWPELVGTCARLVREGKVLAWGALGDEVELVSEAWLAAITCDFSACSRAALPMIAASNAHSRAANPAPAVPRSLAVFARRPLAGGALAGFLGPGVRLAPNDDRRALDTPALEAFAVGAAKLARFAKREPASARSCDAARAVTEQLQRPAHVESMTIAELSLRYVMSCGAIALPRIHRLEDLREALAAAAAPPLDPGLISAIDAIKLDD